jgi:hypothetical protein
MTQLLVVLWNILYEKDERRGEGLPAIISRVHVGYFRVIACEASLFNKIYSFI